MPGTPAHVELAKPEPKKFAGPVSPAAPAAATEATAAGLCDDLEGLGTTSSAWAAARAGSEVTLTAVLAAVSLKLTPPPAPPAVTPASDLRHPRHPEPGRWRPCNWIPDCRTAPISPLGPELQRAMCTLRGIRCVDGDVCECDGRAVDARNPYTLEPAAAGATGARVTSLIETPVTPSARAACGEPMIVVGCADVWVHAPSLYPPLMVTLLISEMPEPSL